MTEPVILVDVLNMVYRSHYAFQNLKDENGKHTGVQYGVLKIINDLRNTVSKRMVFCWDHGIPVPNAERPVNWREALVPQYKSTRKRDPELYKIVVSQLLPLSKAIDHLGYSQFSIMGLEADDVIGVLSQSYSSVLIFSTDKDYYQLLSNKVQVLVPKKEKGQFRVVTQASVEKEFEIPVNRFAEYLALGGDSSDNIKPLRGMGPKTAIKLIHAGVDLRRRFSFAQQPLAVRDKFPQLEDAWENVLKSYHAAQIPKSWTDPRINDCVSKHLEEVAAPIVPPIPEQRWQLKDKSQKQFVQFCSDRNMVSLLGLRHQLFSTDFTPKEATCQNPKHNPKDAKLSKRTLI